MNLDDSGSYQYPSEDVVRQRDKNWKAAVVIVAIGFSVCIVGAVISSQKDHGVALVGETIHRGGMVVVLLGMVGFLIGRRWEHIWNWVDEMLNRMEQNNPTATEISSLVPEPTIVDHLPTRPRFQFSLATFFMVTTAFGITFGLLFSLPGALVVAFVLLSHLMLTIALTVALVYGRSYVKTFCIGALFPAGVILLVLTNFRGFGPSVYGASMSWNDDLLPFRLTVVAEWIGTFFLGIFAIFVRYMIERPARRGPH